MSEREKDVTGHENDAAGGQSGAIEVRTLRRDVGARGDGREPRGHPGVRRYHTPARKSRKSRRPRRLRSATAFTYAHLAPPAPERGPSARVAPSQTSQIRSRPSAPRSRA